MYGYTNGVSGSTAWTTTTNNYVEFTGVQFEKGTVATPFEFRMNELQLCQRYYETRTNIHSVHFYVATYSNSYSGTIGFMVPKRVAPTLTYSGFSAWDKTGTTSSTVTANGNIQTVYDFEYYLSGQYGISFGGTFYANAEL